MAQQLFFDRRGCLPIALNVILLLIAAFANSFFQRPHGAWKIFRCCRESPVFTHYSGAFAAPFSAALTKIWRCESRHIMK
jgi:hypothetical protein